MVFNMKVELLIFGELTVMEFRHMVTKEERCTVLKFCKKHFLDGRLISVLFVWGRIATRIEK